MYASAENFKAYICGKESPVTEVLESAKQFANDDDVVLKLDAFDARSALQASEEVMQKALELQNLCIAEEGISSSIDNFIDQYINSDKSKVALYYNQRIDAAVTEDEINNLVVSIEDDLGEMEDFVSGKLTLPAFLRFVLTWLACVFGSALLGFLGLVGAIALACQKYNKVDRIRKKTQMLIPSVEKCLEKAKAKQKKILKIQ
jgi:hypothetical protein